MDASSTSLNSSLNTVTSHTPLVNNKILTPVHRNSIQKQYDVNRDELDQYVMPPPMVSKVYDTDMKNKNRIYMLSNDKKVSSTALDNFVQFSLSNTLSVKKTSSCTSANTNISKGNSQSFVATKISANDKAKFCRVFSKWKVMLNEQYELIIVGTIEW